MDKLLKGPQLLIAGFGKALAATFLGLFGCLPLRARRNYGATPSPTEVNATLI